MTPKARLAWPNLFEARLNDLSGNVEYSCQLLIAKGDPGLAPMVTAVNAAIEKKWGTNPPKNLRKPFRDGDDEKEGNPDYKGMVFINMKSKQKPGIVDEDVNPIIDQADLMMGDYVRCSFNAYAFDQKGNRGVAFGLRNVQRMGKGEPLQGGMTRPEDDFGKVNAEVSEQDAEALVDSLF
jgi:hypothetical protein